MQIRKFYLQYQTLIISVIKYGCVGVMNLILGLCIYYLLLKILNLNFIIAFSASWLFGTLFSYITNFLWVFKPTEKIEFKYRLLKYLAVNIAVYFLNVFLLGFFVKKFNADPFYLQFLLLPFLVTINFLGIKKWALRKELIISNRPK